MKKLLFGLLSLVATLAQAQLPGYRVPPVPSGGSGASTWSEVSGKPSIFPSDFTILLNKPAKYPSSINLVDGIDTALANRVLKVAGSRLINAGEISKLAGVDQPVSITEKGIWNAKQNALGYPPENGNNKSTDAALGNSDQLYPSQKAVKGYVDPKLQIVMDSATKTRYVYVGDGLGVNSAGAIYIIYADELARIQAADLSAGQLKTGTVAPARLGPGTPGPNTILYGDGWRVPSLSAPASEIGLDLPYAMPLVSTPAVGLRNLTSGVDYVVGGNSASTAPFAAPASTYSQAGMRNGTGSTETGTSYLTTGYVASAGATAFTWGTKQVNLWGRTIIPEEPNSTNNFETDYGAGTGLSNITSGAYIRYRLSGSTLLYETVTRNGSGGETINSIPNLTTNTEFSYYVVVAKDLSSAKFYVNGTLVQTHTTNLPQAGTPFNFLAGISKRAGASARYVIHTQYYPLLSN